MWWEMEVYLSIFKVLFVANLCQARVLPTTRQTRLSLAEPNNNYFYNNIDGHPGTYAFGYDVSDPATGNTQFRTEERYPNGTVAGSYGYLDALGNPHRFKYIADERGYRVKYDPPNQRYRESTTIYPITNTESGTESSITWTRPSKRKNNKNVLNNNELHRRFYERRENDIIENPNYYYLQQ